MANVVWLIIYIVLFGCIVIIRFFRKKQQQHELLINKNNSLKLKCEQLKTHIKEQDIERASLLTENEQLKEALNGNVGYIIERNNKEIQLLKARIQQLENAYNDVASFRKSQELDWFCDKLL